MISKGKPHKGNRKELMKLLHFITEVRITNNIIFSFLYIIFNLNGEINPRWETFFRKCF